MRALYDAIEREVQTLIAAGVSPDRMSIQHDHRNVRALKLALCVDGEIVTNFLADLKLS